MTLLATSTPEHRNHVRILFYGQSITEQEWAKQVAGDLRRRFPNADLEIENRAIGGFAAQMLIRPAEHDLYPFYPDLLIFYVYGSNKEYEQIIRNTRTRTAAEVLMQNDHMNRWPPEVIDAKKDKGAWWTDLMNRQFLPAIAKKYGCGLCDQRSAWGDYLKANHLEPKTLLVDGVHLNAHGNDLMAQLVDQYLFYRPDLTDAEWKDLSHTSIVGKDVQWKDGKLTLAFEGNRVDLIPQRPLHSGDAASHAAARVLIDGKKPGEFPGAYRITRPRPGPWTPLFLSEVGHDSALVLESWTLKLTSISPADAKDPKTWDFDVTGSVTGPDGSGTSDKPFVSKSGRVKIDPAAWFRAFHPPLKAGYTIQWDVLPMFVETYSVPKIEDPAKENATTIIQGIPNGTHTLELIADEPANPPAVMGVRTYKPPMSPK